MLSWAAAARRDRLRMLEALRRAPRPEEEGRLPAGGRTKDGARSRRACDAAARGPSRRSWEGGWGGRRPPPGAPLSPPQAIYIRASSG